MRTSLIALTTLGALVISAGAFGQADRTMIDATPYNISIKGGVYFPIDSNLRDVDSLFGGFGVEYLLPKQLIPGSETFFELDWLFHTTSSGNLNGFPLTINQRFWGGPGSGLFGNGGRSYLYAGLGATWFDPRGQARLTFHGGVGTTLGEKTFLEAAAYVAEQDKKLGVRNTGVLVSLGYRF